MTQQQYGVGGLVPEGKRVTMSKPLLKRARPALGFVAVAKPETKREPKNEPKESKTVERREQRTGREAPVRHAPPKRGR